MIHQSEELFFHASPAGSCDANKQTQTHWAQYIDPLPSCVHAGRKTLVQLNPTGPAQCSSCKTDSDSLSNCVSVQPAEGSAAVKLRPAVQGLTLFNTPRNYEAERCVGSCQTSLPTNSQRAAEPPSPPQHNHRHTQVQHERKQQQNKGRPARRKTEDWRIGGRGFPIGLHFVLVFCNCR